MSDTWDDDEDFLIDDVKEDSASPQSKWKMLIVDDEEGIHEVTKIALKRFSFEGKGLEFLSAHSAADAISLLKSQSDVALILLDVVMENDHAGLDCARQIREDLNLFSTRIVLRTGQPGIAPEEDVILAYDINDYRAKTELTTERLFTTVVSALRSYRDILALNEYREDAYRMLKRSNNTVQSLIDFSSEALAQIGQDFVIHKCNQAFASLFKQTPPALVGNNLKELKLDAIISCCTSNSSEASIQILNNQLQCKCEKTEDGYNVKLLIGS